jgi:hypothetical protein
MLRAICVMATAACLLVACDSDPVAAGGACKEASECVTGLVCNQGVCAAAVVEPPPPPAEPPMPRGVEAIRKAKGAGKTAQDGVDKRMKDILGPKK